MGKQKTTHCSTDSLGGSLWSGLKAVTAANSDFQASAINITEKRKKQTCGIRKGQENGPVWVKEPAAIWQLMEIISAGEGPHFIIQDTYFLSMIYHCWPHLLKMQYIHVRYCSGPSLKVADESAPAEHGQRQKTEQEHAVLRELKNTKLCPDPSKTQRWIFAEQFFLLLPD